MSNESISQFASFTEIKQFIDIEQKHRNLEWLKQALAMAIEVELSTLPPYLCAWWSIIDSNTEAANIIKSIILEEMLHMGLACNMLTAIGGTPKITIPKYPGHLPGNIHPKLTVYLSGLTKDYLENIFLKIEKPIEPIEIREKQPLRFALFVAEEVPVQTYPTIGAFYDEIFKTFHDLSPQINITNQLVADHINLYKIQTLDDVEKAITEIKQQGEGTASTPKTDPKFGQELSHYYKFSEILHGKKIVFENNQWSFSGDEIPWPDTYPMAKVPDGGWTGRYSNPSWEVRHLLIHFNAIFNSMLNKLESAWINGNQGDLGNAVNEMFQLKSPAVELMKIPLPNSSNNYGPDFL